MFILDFLKKTKTAESGPNRNWIHPSIQINLIEKWFIIRPWLKSLEKIKLWKKNMKIEMNLSLWLIVVYRRGYTAVDRHWP